MERGTSQFLLVLVQVLATSEMQISFQARIPSSVCPSPARGKAIPPDTPHSVIVSLPEWEDNVLCYSFETTCLKGVFRSRILDI